MSRKHFVNQLGCDDRVCDRAIRQQGFLPQYSMALPQRLARAWRRITTITPGNRAFKGKGINSHIGVAYAYHQQSATTHILTLSVIHKPIISKAIDNSRRCVGNHKTSEQATQQPSTAAEPLFFVLS